MSTIVRVRFSVALGREVVQHPPNHRADLEQDQEAQSQDAYAAYQLVARQPLGLIGRAFGQDVDLGFV